MKEFFLVFEDMLDTTQKIVIGPIKAESEKLLANKLGLKLCICMSQGTRNRYWDGKKAGDVIIYICPTRDNKIEDQNDLQKLAHQLHCDWY